MEQIENFRKKYNLSENYVYHHLMNRVMYLYERMMPINHIVLDIRLFEQYEDEQGNFKQMFGNIPHDDIEAFVYAIIFKKEK